MHFLGKEELHHGETAKGQGQRQRQGQGQGRRALILSNAEQTTEFDDGFCRLLMNLPIVSTRIRLLELPSGSIDLEPGGDGVYLQFNCDCLDALPYCRARCCSIRGIYLTLEETLSGQFDMVSGAQDSPEIRRRADGYCIYNQTGTCLCSVYEQRPETCQGFHCSRGVGMRGWKLELYRHADEE